MDIKGRRDQKKIIIVQCDTNNHLEKKDLDRFEIVEDRNKSNVTHRYIGKSEWWKFNLEEQL